MNEQIYILTEQNEVKESSSIYYGDDKGTPQPVKQVYRTDGDGKVVLAKCYHNYNITYTWNDYDYSCTATAECEYISEHQFSEIVEDTYTTNLSNTKYNYIANFTNPLFKTQAYYVTWQDITPDEPDAPEVCTHTGYSYTTKYNSTQHYKVCSNCGEIYDKENHDPRETDSHAGDCCNKSMNSYKCSEEGCGWTETVYGEKDPTNHIGLTEKTTSNHKAPDGTVGSYGTITVDCTACGATNIEKRKFRSHEIKEPNSWAIDTNSHYKCCQQCWEVYVEEDHQGKWVSNDMTGSCVRVCTVCNVALTSGTAHQHGKYEYKDCYTHKVLCNRCGKYLKDEAHTDDGTGQCKYCGSVLGHDYSEGYVVINDVHHAHVCTRCGFVSPGSETVHNPILHEEDELAYHYICEEACGYEYVEAKENGTV